MNTSPRSSESEPADENLGAGEQAHGAGTAGQTAVASEPAVAVLQAEPEGRAEAPSAIGTPSLGIYAVNTLLMAAAVILWMLWFRIHLDSYLVTTALAVFGGGALLVALPVIAPVFATIRRVVELALGKAGMDHIEKESQKFVRALLGSRAALAVYAVAAVLGVAALAVTSSVHLDYAWADRFGAQPAPLTLKIVRISDDGSRTVEHDSVVLSSDDTAFDGRPLFFDSRRREVEILEPRGIDAKEIAFNRLGVGRLKVPKDCEKHVFRILHVVPGPQLFRVLPKPGHEHDAEHDQYYLEAQIGHRFRRLGVFHRGSVLIGAPREDLIRFKDLIRGRDAEQRRDDLDKVLDGYARDRGVPVMAAALKEQILAQWLGTIETAETPEFSLHDTVALRVVKVPAREDQAEEIGLAGAKVAPGGAIQTVLMEIKETQR